ncbi:hypothetical protein FHR99_003177 [Litorivivens lipolytica]|uniref:Uncharacterized protein n=1 Tax=Litorivivens lipolytica TaxID=1524264 RepID=A0A7W4Z747_9GAMM|nr:hypothetical protein [Litorivivens lipolytica]MBB3048903.1 hypothetical protein [Litorivivens lipolytica]
MTTTICSNPNPTADSKLNLKGLPVNLETRQKAIAAVEQAALDANVSPLGFVIDSSLCDCGEIETAGVADVLDATAGLFGEHGSEGYTLVLETLCEDISVHFAQAPSRKGTDAAYSAVLAHSGYAGIDTNAPMEEQIGALMTNLQALAAEYGVATTDATAG